MIQGLSEQKALSLKILYIRKMVIMQQKLIEGMLLMIPK